ncbi:NAC domain-containing protein 55-like protein, partial [Tanacetum coccineum]
MNHSTPNNNVQCQCGCQTTIAAKKAVLHAFYIDSRPVGKRCGTNDEVRIRHKLLNKYKISMANLYEDHPRNIVGNYPQAKEGEWYFFTSRNRKYMNGKRPDRKTAGGYWKACAPDKDITNNGTRIGAKKPLVYYEGLPPNGIKTNWRMHEYVAKGCERERTSSEDMKLDDYVLCKIYNRAQRREKDIKVQVTNDQQPRVDSIDLHGKLPTILEVENELIETSEQTLPDQPACVVVIQDKNFTNMHVTH